MLPLPFHQETKLKAGTAMIFYENATMLLETLAMLAVGITGNPSSRGPMSELYSAYEEVYVRLYQCPRLQGRYRQM